MRLARSNAQAATLMVARVICALVAIPQVLWWTFNLDLWWYLVSPSLSEPTEELFTSLLIGAVQFLTALALAWLFTLRESKTALPAVACVLAAAYWSYTCLGFYTDYIPVGTPTVANYSQWALETWPAVLGALVVLFVWWRKARRGAGVAA